MPNLAPISIRTTPSEREMLKGAAESARTSLSDYIRRKALEAAEMDLMERRIVTIPAEDWERFEAWAKSPPKDLPKLRELLSVRPAWED